MSSEQVVFSGDQQVFSSWDSMIKLAGYASSGKSGQVIHHFHLADGFGKSANGQTEPHLTNETYRYQDGKEIQPAWFAITEMWPIFPELSTVPHALGRIIGEKFDDFAHNFAAVQSKISDEQKSAIQSVMTTLGFRTHIPRTADEMYEMLTSSTSYGIADGKDVSGSAYNFCDIEDLQKKSMLKLHRDTASRAPESERAGVRARFDELVREDSKLFQAVKNKSFPQLARNVFQYGAQRLEELTGVDITATQLEDTTEYFELIDKNGEISKKPEAFAFLDWYLQNKELYNTAHNEVSEEISQHGGNPIQTLASHKGETPFWIIVDGQKHKLSLHKNAIGIVKREQGQSVEITIPTDTTINSHRELASAIKQAYEGKEVTVIPTALGLALQLRAQGTLLLPEHGSSYVPQLNKTYERMLLVASKKEYKDLIPQSDIMRIHPHGIKSLPDGAKIKLPGHLKGTFPVDEDGFTLTDDIKKTWEEVVAQRKTALEASGEAHKMTEKARILFEGSRISEVDLLLDQIDAAETAVDALKPEMTEVLDIVKSGLDKSQMRSIRDISSFIKADLDTLSPEIETLVESQRTQIDNLRVRFKQLKGIIAEKKLNEQILTYFVALRTRQFQASTESLEYYDARPSILSVYLLFGEQGVRNLIENTTSYEDKTPKPIDKKWYDAEGNRITVIADSSGANDPQKKRLAGHIANNLARDGFDTAMVLLPTTDDEADFRIEQVCQDGSIGGMCGNGIRAVARYAHDTWGTSSIKLITKSGDRVEGFFDGEKYGAALNSVQLHPDTKDAFKEIIPEKVLNDTQLVENLRDILQSEVNTNTVYGETAKVMSVASISGEPHVVVALNRSISEFDEETLNIMIQIANSINSTQIKKVGQIFPNDVNVSFVARKEEEFYIATHERGGPGITGACGTGSVAILDSIKPHRIEDVIFRTPAGTLHVQAKGATYVIKGDVQEVL